MTVYSCSKKFKVLFILLSVAIIVFAFWHSTQDSETSSGKSEGLLLFLQNILSAVGIKVEISEHFIRKAAHFTEYTGLGAMMMCSAFTFDKLRPYRYYFNLLFVGLATAVCDEAIQLNVPGRAGLVTDVILDFSGVLFGSLVMLVIFLLYKRRFIKKSTKIRKEYLS